MDNRTIQILGQGYGTVPATITVKANGNTVFSGAVNTVDNPNPPRNTPVPQLLYSFEIDRSFTGAIPMTCEVSSGTVLFESVKTNYMLVPNPIYTTEEMAVLSNPDATDAEYVVVYSAGANPPFTQTEIDNLLDPAFPDAEKEAIVAAHNCQSEVLLGVDSFAEMSPDPLSSLILYTATGNIPLYADHAEAPGTWSWLVSENETLGFNLTVPPLE
jgi:hypothetical protein